MPLLSDEGLFEACGVRIAFSGREGGVSEGAYSSLNLGAHVEDDPVSVGENRRRLLDALGVPSADLIVPNQVHGTRLVTVSEREAFVPVQEQAAQGADGVEVMCCNVAALLCFADCMPVILVSPSGAFAVVHAGWRGVYGHIAVDALRSLFRKTGCSPADCNVYLGPFIHPECFEVSLDLGEKFASEFGRSCVVDSRHVDLEKAIRSDLVEAGADSLRILSAGICTVCNPGEYYSYRASGGTCGRHGAIAVRVVSDTGNSR
ncbi:MAG: polyphenol oxidase family protein [Eggerthellaceae bacterium]